VAAVEHTEGTERVSAPRGRVHLDVRHR
jgi:hypothetical protein